MHKNISFDLDEIKKTHLECGKIINTHGIKGTLKVDSWCDSPEILADLEKVFMIEDGKLKKYRVLSSAIFKRFVLLDLEGIATIESAERFKEKILYLDRNDIELDEGDIFIADLIGLPVIDAESGVEYGTLTDVINAGASDIYVVNTSSGEAMIPAVKEFIKSIDVEKGIFVTPIEGMF